MEPLPVGATPSDELMQRLAVHIESLGGAREQLDGWRAELKLRTTGTRAGSYDTYFISPWNGTFRSRLEVILPYGRCKG